MIKRNLKIYEVIGLLIGFIIIGRLVPNWVQYLMIASMANGMVVLGLLILKRVGLVSFGQALYSGLGAYTVGMLGHFYGVSELFVLLPAGVASSLLLGWILGFLMAKYRAIFFAMLSLAFSMVLWGMFVKSEELGGTDGFHVIKPTILGFAPEGADLTFVLFIITAVLMVCCMLGIHRYLKSTIGFLGEGIRENELRVEYLGSSVKKIVHAKYTIATGLAGLGGGITALLAGHIDPDLIHWAASGEFVFITVLSGTGNVVAPFIGSFLFELLKTFALEYAAYVWQLIIGVTLLLVILFLPDGLWSLAGKLKSNKHSEKGVVT